MDKDNSVAFEAMKASVMALPSAPVPPVTNTTLFEKSYFSVLWFSFIQSLIYNVQHSKKVLFCPRIRLHMIN
jgi:hypothetical protein